MCLSHRERIALELYDRLVARNVSERAAWRIARKWAKLPPDYISFRRVSEREADQWDSRTGSSSG
jgi:hypothetical protein